MKINKFLTLLLLLSSLLFIYQCSDEKSLDELIEEGKSNLEIGNGIAAKKSFSDALEIDPTNDKASFGMVLAIIQDTLHQLEVVITMATGLFENPDSSLIDSFPMDEFVNGLFNNLLVPTTDQLIRLLNESDIKKNPSFAFDLKNYPLYFMGKKLADLGGEYDLGDALLIEGFVYLIKGISEYTGALFWGFDPTLLDTSISKEDDLVTFLTKIAKSFEAILTDKNYPKFLKVRDKEKIYASENDLAKSMSVLNSAIDQILKEAQSDTAQSDDIVIIDDKEGFVNPLKRVVKQIVIDSSNIDGIKKGLSSLQESFELNIPFDVSNLSLFINEFLGLPYKLTLPSGCVVIEIPLYFSGADTLRQTLSNITKLIQDSIPKIEETQNIIALINQYLKSNPTLQVAWMNFANNLIKTNPSNVEEKADQIDSQVQNLIALLTALLEKTDDPEQQKQIKSLIETLEAVSDILKLVSKYPKDFAELFQATGYLMEVMLDIFTSLPAPPTLLTMEEIFYFTQKYIPQLKPVIIKLIPPVVSIWNKLPSDLKNEITVQMQKVLGPKQVDKIVCILNGIKIE